MRAGGKRLRTERESVGAAAADACYTLGNVTGQSVTQFGKSQLYITIQ